MSSENVWEDASSDEDYQYQEEDTEVGSTDDIMDDEDIDDDDEYADPSALLNPELAHQLFQQFSGTGLFATLNEAFISWNSFDQDDEDYGIDELIHVGAFAKDPLLSESRWVANGLAYRCRIRVRCWRARWERG